MVRCIDIAKPPALTFEVAISWRDGATRCARSSSRWRDEEVAAGSATPTAIRRVPIIIAPPLVVAGVGGLGDDLVATRASGE